MTNPFEYFNASDDDEPKTTHVKKEDKHKLSTSSLNQLTPKSGPTKSSKKIRPRKLPKLPSKPEEALLRNLFPKESRKILIEDTTCLVTSNANSTKKYGVKRIPPATSSTVDQEPAESNYNFTQRPTQKGWRRLRKRWKPQGLARAGQVCQGR